jgi:uncharacterized protein YlxP (DUF503 family)
VFVGVLRLVLHLPQAHSLKDKRQVVRSFKDRVHSRLKLSVAEVGDADRLQAATLAVVAVSSDSAPCYEMLAQARNLAATLPEALLADARERVLSLGSDGSAMLDDEPFAFSKRGPVGR